MRKLYLGLLFLACAFGEESLTIAASRSLTPQPDQAVFVVYVMSPLNTDLSDVLAAVAGSGITAGNLSNLSSSISTTGTTVNNPQYEVTVNWVFTLNVPFAKLKDTVGTLTALQQSIGKNGSGLTLSYSGQGTGVSAQLQASQSCPIPDLVADARAQAQKLANAAGATVGPILAMTDASYAGNAGATLIQSPTFVFATSAFASTSSVIFSSQVGCAIVVKFSLLRTQ